MNTIARGSAVTKSGTEGRRCAQQGLRDFLTGLTDMVVDMSVWTAKDDLYAAYLKWAKSNTPGYILGPNQFSGEVFAATGYATSSKAGKSGFRFLAIRPGLA